MTNRVAIMQPYFFPYLGYFRLFSETDLFVIYDCVQFPRRGWVHRNKFKNPNGEDEWLTLPIKKADRSIKIKDLEFQENSQQEWIDRINYFPLLKEKLGKNEDLYNSVAKLDCSVIEYLIRNLKIVCDLKGFHFNTVRSSELNIDESLKGQDRIIAIAKEYKATEYINSPGGVDLYDENEFRKHEIKLAFLDKYSNMVSSLDDILTKI